MQDAGATAEEETIAPTAFRRAAETAATQAEAGSHTMLRTVIGVALGLLIIASFLLFTSKSVKFEVTPVSYTHLRAHET